MIKTRTWVILFSALLVFSAVAAILVKNPLDNGKSDEKTIAKVYLNSECVHTVCLSDVTEPYTIQLTGENGTNTISVENGRICVSSADCPDQLCVKQGWQSSGITPIVCLPNKLVIEFERSSDTTTEADGISK